MPSRFPNGFQPMAVLLLRGAMDEGLFSFTADARIIAREAEACQALGADNRPPGEKMFQPLAVRRPLLIRGSGTVSMAAAERPRVTFSTRATPATLVMKLEPP